MIANRTTLILGAGASAPAYPTGAELIDRMIGSYTTGSMREKLALRLRASMLPSIDAFLAEEGNSDLLEHGRQAIAEALIPCEKKAVPAWYRLLFNAIRSPRSSKHSHRLQIVTFNYDLSLEHSLWRAFSTAYKIEGEAAKARMDESINIIHVYGQLGKIAAPSGDRLYGETIHATQIETAAKGIEIIGRKPDDPRFNQAHEAIAGADFLAILGFGFDETNVANLKLTELAKDKAVFSTGYNMGYGMRAWLRYIGLPKIMIAPPTHDVETFLTKSAFLHWANIPGLNGHQMHGAIASELKAQKYHLPDY
jgi:hypothetical protein